MRRNILTQELLDDIRNSVQTMTNKEIADMINSRYGMNISDSWVHNAMGNHGIKRTGRVKRTIYSDVFPKEVAEFIRENCKGTGPTEMAQILSDKFDRLYTANMVRAYYKNHGLKSGLDGRIRPGDPRIAKNSFQKGCHVSRRTEFKKGQRPHNALEVGTVITNGEGYLRIKVAEPKKWEFLHRKVWRDANGPIPKGYMVIFLDGDKENCQLENLALISIAENSYLNQKKLRMKTADATKVGVMAARLSLKARQIRNGGQS